MTSEKCRVCGPNPPPSYWHCYGTDLWDCESWGCEGREPIITAACQECLANGSAIPGDLTLQDTTSLAPRFEAYSDHRRRCTHCGVSYVFSASEQKHWYEELKFYTQSEPKGCKDCRARRRQRRKVNERLSKATALASPENWLNHRELGRLCLELGATRKASRYLRRARNLCEIESVREELLAEAEAAERTPADIPLNGQFSRLSWISSKTKPDSLKSIFVDTRPVLSEKGLEICDEIYRRWQLARYGQVSRRTY